MRRIATAFAILLAWTLSPLHADDSPRSVIHVVSHGWHTGIILTLDATTIELCPPLADFRYHRFVEIGWGDEGFYRADSIGVGTALRAIAWPSPTVLHILGFDFPVEEEFATSDIVRLELAPEGYRALLATISTTFAERASIGTGIYGDSRFYRAVGSYYFPNTCNVWTLRTLGDAGVPTTPLLGIRADAAMVQIARAGTAIRLDPSEAKWPYGLATIAGLALAAWDLRRRGRLDPPPPRDCHLRNVWLLVLLAAIATFVLVVVSANDLAWARVGSRVAIGGFVAALGMIAVVSGHRLRGCFRWREAISIALAALGIVTVLSPL